MIILCNLCLGIVNDSYYFTQIAFSTGYIYDVDEKQLLTAAVRLFLSLYLTSSILPQADASEVLSLVKDLNEQAMPPLKQEHLNEDIIKEMAFQASGDLAPVNAFIGGLAAQEVMKVQYLKNWLDNKKHSA